VVKLPLENGANVEAIDLAGSALYWEAYSGHKAMVKLLLEKGANVEVKDSFGWTALYTAGSSGHEVVVKLLLKKGADVKVRAVLNGHQAVVKTFDGFEDFLHLAVQQVGENSEHAKQHFKNAGIGLGKIA
jgi:ankyrin repeat protein